MRLSKRTNTIILWTISIALLVSMVVAFTPSFSQIFAGNNTNSVGQSVVANVNSDAVTEFDVSRLMQQSQFYRAVSEGPVADDLQLMAIDQLIQNTLLQQASKDEKVSSAAIREEVNTFRQQQNVAGSSNNSRYISLLSNMGYTDATFRDAIRAQLKRDQYLELLREAVTVDEAQIAAYYALNQDSYTSDEQLLARQIVVEDRELADNLAARIAAGEDFAELAREFSTERADRDGALGGVAGSTEPEPIGRAALPTQVANAAFSLQAEGVTEVVEAAGVYYIISVEEVLPAEPLPLEEVRDRVHDDVLAVEQDAVVQAQLTDIRANSDISPGSSLLYQYEDAVVATVGSEEILTSELALATYPQFQQFLSPSSADTITNFFKPLVLDQLIEQELAYLGAQDLEATFVGSKTSIAQGALEFVSQDAAFSEEDIQSFYETNTAQFTLPASAEIVEVRFDGEAEATAFRQALLEGADLEAAIEDNGGQSNDYGEVGQGQLPTELDIAVFETDGFDALPDGREVSDILVIDEPVVLEPSDAPEETSVEEGASEEGTAEASASVPGEEPSQASATQTAYVVLVGTRTLERVQDLDEVRSQVEESVLNEKRNSLRTAWLEELRSQYEVANLLTPDQSDTILDFNTTPVDATDEVDDSAATDDSNADETPEGSDQDNQAGATEDSGDNVTDDTGTDDTNE